MTLYSYVLKHDTGFAPNPYFGACSLATCKPRIRARASVGDWIMGTTGRRYAGDGFGLVYAMRLDEVLSFRAYSKSPIGRTKTPSPMDTYTIRGDAIYSWNARAAAYEQVQSPFHAASEMGHDLSADRVLIGRKFVYFGKDWLKIPPEFQSFVKRGPGHRVIREPEGIAEFIYWLDAEITARGLPWGSVGTPNDFEDGTNYRWQTERRARAACG